ncbi:RrF2 family transcriptional regulator [Chitinimonas naiadis]
MQLTRFSDFGLRVLMYLSQHERPAPVTIAEIASQFDIPHNHLIKVVNKLGKLGWVTTLRGRNGGLRLAVSADTLHLGKVLRGLEASTELINCDEPVCVLRGRCLLKRALNAGLDAFYQTMDDYTLADVCAKGTGEAIVTMHRRYLVQLEAGAGHA